MTDDEIKAALNEFDVFWLTLWAECRSEPVEGQIAVASVIRNRVGKRFGDSYKEVCLAPKQFSCWNPGSDLNHQRLMEKARLVIGDYAERTALPFDPRVDQLKWIAEGVMGGRVIDLTHGADHYLTTTLLDTTPPTWAVGQTARVIASHAFLNLG